MSLVSGISEDALWSAVASELRECSPNLGIIFEE